MTSRTRKNNTKRAIIMTYDASIHSFVNEMAGTVSPIPTALTRSK